MAAMRMALFLMKRWWRCRSFSGDATEDLAEDFESEALLESERALKLGAGKMHLRSALGLGCNSPDVSTESVSERPKVESPSNGRFGLSCGPVFCRSCSGSGASRPRCPSSWPQPL